MINSTLVDSMSCSCQLQMFSEISGVDYYKVNIRASFTKVTKPSVFRFCLRIVPKRIFNSQKFATLRYDYMHAFLYYWTSLCRIWRSTNLPRRVQVMGSFIDILLREWANIIKRKHMDACGYLHYTYGNMYNICVYIINIWLPISLTLYLYT